jgi:carboxypeptidase C (cathepsin A)
VEENAKGSPKINLQAIAVGNGLVEPLTQYGAYADFAAANGLVDADTQASVNDAYNTTCAPAIVACQGDSRTAMRAALRDATGPGNSFKGSLTAASGELAGSPMSCILAADVCNAGVVAPLLQAAAAKEGHQVNVYDIRDACSHPPLCYDMSDLDTYMGLPDVLDALGATGRSWTECSTSVHMLLTEDWMQNLEVRIPTILAAKVRVLIYAGDQDFICNVEGNRRWVETMQWAGAAQFAAAPMRTWHVKGAPVGQAKTAGGLTFLQVYQAGHMVPMDQPEAALDMLQRLMDNRGFDDTQDGSSSAPMARIQGAGALQKALTTAADMWRRVFNAGTGGLVLGNHAKGAVRRAQA